MRSVFFCRNVLKVNALLDLTRPEEPSLRFLESGRTSCDQSGTVFCLRFINEGIGFGFPVTPIDE